MVDKAPAPATTSRAVGLQPRGLEVLDRAAPYPDGLRTLAGISFPGVQIMERFLIADVHADLPMSRDAGLLWLQGASPLVAFPLPGTDLWRLVAPASDGGSGRTRLHAELGSRWVLQRHRHRRA